ncbi:porin [Neisseria chenwenguii]|uniref:Porin n=1 Tax=Neisseria chenwenguii TaxID=1853278 RepID=A0A220S024_9NEIS|nr:porin [Neisseria chenwenguii]ASK26738.1 porin [Neisseria chenwenguii]
MKQNKNKLAFIVSTAFLAAPASAVSLINYEPTGTKLDFVGSARLQWKTEAVKKTEYDDGKVDSITKEAKNHPIQNNGSRFGFKLNQSLGNDLYGLGRVEWRFRGKDNRGNRTPSNHDFDHLYARQLYAGVGHNKYGELTYGNQTVITDEVKQTDLANTLSLSDGLLTSGMRRSIQYAYRNKDQGIKAGVYYSGGSKRDNNGLTFLDDDDSIQELKDAWGTGAVKTFKIDDKQEFILSGGVTRERFTQRNNAPDRTETAYAVGTAYTYDNTTIGLDVERGIYKNHEEAGRKITENEIRSVIYQKLTSNWRAYGMYAYKTQKRDEVGESSARKKKKHQFMLGTEYYLIPKSKPFSVKTFAEVQANRTKSYRRGDLREKEREYITVVGLRAYW